MKRFGPFTPQETDRLVDNFKKNEIPFEIVFDHEANKADREFSAENVVSLAEFRTKSYLGQYYYLEVDEEKLSFFPEIHRQLKATSGDAEDSYRRMSVDSFPSLYYCEKCGFEKHGSGHCPKHKIPLLFEDDYLKILNARKKKKKSFTAIAILVLLVAYVVYHFIRAKMRGEL